MSMVVLESGWMTTVQDLGRTGMREYGIVTSGVMDRWSALLVNTLVGNLANDALLEFTQPGLSVRFLQPALIAIGGADLDITVDGCVVPTWRPLFVEAGSVLTCRNLRNGVWCYLAVAGGLDVPVWQHSRATDLQCEAGGYLGRVLQKQDELTICSEKSEWSARIMKKTIATARSGKCVSFFGKSPRTDQGRQAGEAIHLIRVVAGEHDETLFGESFTRWFTQPFRVTRDVSRMGYRLEGETLLTSSAFASLPSRPVVPGTIQVPPSGKPIVLLADCQTVGGYAVPAFVVSRDLGEMAQIEIGHQVLFTQVNHETARSLFIQQMRDLNELRVGLTCWASM